MIKLTDILGLNEGKKKNESLMSSENKEKKSKKLKKENKTKKETVTDFSDFDRKHRIDMKMKHAGSNKYNSLPGISKPSGSSTKSSSSSTKPKTESKKTKVPLKKENKTCAKGEKKIADKTVKVTSTPTGFPAYKRKFRSIKEGDKPTSTTSIKPKVSKTAKNSLSKVNKANKKLRAARPGTVIMAYNRRDKGSSLDGGY